MTTPFLETPRFPDDLAFWARGGVSFNTSVASSTSGRETRNSVWKFGRGQWDLQNAYRTASGVADPLSVQYLRNFFRVCKGQAYGFRFRDYTDYTDEGNGVLGPVVANYGIDVSPTGAGNGSLTMQLYKRYVAAPLADYRLIAKPLSVQVYRNAVLQTLTTNYALDTTTGIVTWVADSSASLAGWTPGATTSFTVSALPSGWTVGTTLYFSSITGDTNSVLNGKTFAITAVSGTTVTIGAVTTGLTLSGGQAGKYPQPTDTLTWTGTFDTPVRFGTDQFSPQMDVGTGALYGFQTLTIAEIRP